MDYPSADPIRNDETEDDEMEFGIDEHIQVIVQ